MLKFLELLGEAGASLEEHVAGFLMAGYGASISSMEYHARRYRRNKNARRALDDQQRILHHRYFVMRDRLQKGGLIARGGAMRGIRLTQKGILCLRQLRKDKKSYLPKPVYKLKPGVRVIIVAFDVPEKKRRKRDWLRKTLKSIGMRLIQQSVWVGRGILPPEFLEDIEKMELMSFVEIFEVTKNGTLESIFD